MYMYEDVWREQSRIWDYILTRKSSIGATLSARGICNKNNKQVGISAEKRPKRCIDAFSSLELNDLDQM